MTVFNMLSVNSCILLINCVNFLCIIQSPMQFYILEHTAADWYKILILQSLNESNKTSGYELCPAD